MIEEKAAADLKHRDEEWRLDKHSITQYTDVFVPKDHPNLMQVSQEESQDGAETLSAHFNVV